MPNHSWEQVTKEHVVAAIRLYEQQPDRYSRSRSTFLVFEENEYPAKAIRGIAYALCHGEDVNSEEYAGGMETMRFFTRLGFHVLHTNRASTTQAQIPPISRKRQRSPRTLDKRRQKHALQRLLQQYGVLVTEMTFSWLRVPSFADMDADYRRIYDALCSYRGHADFIAPGLSLAVDMYVESLGLIIEYDEDQHFSQARYLALNAYPDQFSAGFSRDAWMAACATVQATDNAPVTRDETRAFYDTVRDFEVTRRGFRLIRLRHGEIDWEANDAPARLAAMIGVAGPPPAHPMTSASVTVLTRAVLNLGITPTQLRELGQHSAGIDLWLGHRRHLCQTYRQDPRGYEERLARLLQICAAKQTEILLLPACTMLHAPDLAIADAMAPYQSMCRHIPWVVTGDPCRQMQSQFDLVDQSPLLIHYRLAPCCSKVPCSVFSTSRTMSSVHHSLIK